MTLEWNPLSESIAKHAATHSPRCLLAGVGSPFGDDCVGWLAVEQIHEHCPAALAIKVRSPSELLNHLSDIDHLHVIDACRGAGSPGTIFQADWPSAQLSPLNFGGTHDLSLNTVLNLAGELSLLPPRVTVWGIEISDDELRRSHSPGVERSTDQTATTNPSNAVSFDQHLSLAVAAALEQLVATLTTRLKGSLNQTLRPTASR